MQQPVQPEADPNEATVTKAAASPVNGMYLKTELDRKKIIAVIYTAFAVVKRKPEKKSSCTGFEAYDLCDTGAAP